MNKYIFYASEKSEKVAHNFKDITGQKFGRLTVTKLAGYFYCKELNKKKSAWFTDCLCGTKNNVVRGNDLRSGQCKSCGCHKREITIAFNKRTKTKEVHSGFAAVWQSYKIGAKIRNLEFLLSKEEFFDLTQMECFYCKQKPKQKRKCRYKNKDTNFIFNGIDRVDSRIGYIKENCVPACKTCNIMKRELSLDDFLNKIKSIYQNIDIIKSCRVDHQQSIDC